MRASELELAGILGPAREMSVFVATWNLNLSTNIDPDMLTRFLVERNKTKCDVYVLGAQEIPVEGIVEWEVMLQRCLGKAITPIVSKTFLTTEKKVVSGSKVNMSNPIC